MKLKELKTDKNKVENGVWFDFLGDVRLRLAKGGGEAQRKFCQRHYPSTLKRVRDKVAKADEIKEMTVAMLANTVVLEIDGLTDDDGNAIEATPETVTELLSDPELDELYTFVLESCNDTASYRNELDEEAAGN